MKEGLLVGLVLGFVFSLGLVIGSTMLSEDEPEPPKYIYVVIPPRDTAYLAVPWDSLMCAQHEWMENY